MIHKSYMIEYKYYNHTDKKKGEKQALVREVRLREDIERRYRRSIVGIDFSSGLECHILN